jgi:hypothetical protein
MLYKQLCDQIGINNLSKTFLVVSKFGYFFQIVNNCVNTTLNYLQKGLNVFGPKDF